MATINVDERMFECPVCIEEIDETCKMLPCQHTFCLNCLEKLYKNDGNPQCPTCRQHIDVSIEQLQKPRLLLNLLEKLKINEEEKKNPEKDENLAIAIELSIDDYNKKQEVKSSTTEQENLQLQIALNLSENQAVLEAEKQSLLSATEADLTTALNLSIQEYEEREANISKQEELELQNALLRSERETLLMAEERLKYEIALMKSSFQADNVDNRIYSDTTSTDSKSSLLNERDEEVDLCSDNLNAPNPVVELEQVGELNTDFHASNENLCINSNLHSDTSLAMGNFIIPNDAKIDINPKLSRIPIKENDDYAEACASISLKLNVPDLSSYLQIKHRKPILDSIFIETNDEKKLNLLKMVEISWYLEVIDDYLKALEYYRREQKNKIVEHCAGNTEILEHFLLLEDWDSNKENATSCETEEDADLVLALELSRNMFIEKNEDELFDCTLKSSEMLDSIDTLHTQFLCMKEKLQFRMAVIASEQ